MTLTMTPTTRPSSSTRTTSFDLRSARRHRGRWEPLPVWTAGSRSPLPGCWRARLGGLDVPVCVWVAARSRLAEDWLITSDAEQYVILGAGLDSFAWRQLERARVFEVDEGVVGPWDARLWHDRPSI